MYNVSLRINSLIPILRHFCLVQLTLVQTHTVLEKLKANRKFWQLPLPCWDTLCWNSFRKPRAFVSTCVGSCFIPSSKPSSTAPEGQQTHACLPTNPTVLLGYKPCLRRDLEAWVLGTNHLCHSPSLFFRSPFSQVRMVFVKCCIQSGEKCFLILFLKVFFFHIYVPF